MKCEEAGSVSGVQRKQEALRGPFSQVAGAEGVGSDSSTSYCLCGSGHIASVF